ncbi:MAG TPA: hypothetical protein PKW90_25265, partial [Myxococcota bacterium]|nr:hypothetical protein [Myxococcota bacterium]
RTYQAGLRIDDPQISEAHALLSLRGEALVLLPLRRRIYVEHRPMESVTLRAGMQLGLAPRIDLTVEEVALPTTVLGIEGEGLPAQVLTHTCSLVLHPQPRLEPGTLDRAAAIFWPADVWWRMRPAGGADVDFEPGTRVTVQGQQVWGIAFSLSTAGQSPTLQSPFGAVHIISQFDTVHLQTGSGGTLVLAGQLARVVSELVTIGAPISWEGLAAQIWSDLPDRDLLRKRWDVLMVQLRKRLKEGGIRPDLIRSTGTGLVELVRMEGDLVEDRA